MRKYVCVCVCVCVCVRVSVSALSLSQFLTYFDEIWHRRLEPDAKGPFGVKSNKGPYFNSILPQNRHLHNAFSMGVLKHFSDVACGPIAAVHNSNDVAWRPPTPKCQKRVKGAWPGSRAPVTFARYMPISP